MAAQKDSPQTNRPVPISTWDSRYGRTLTPDEKRELQRNLSGYFDLLAKLQSKYGNYDKNPNT